MADEPKEKDEVTGVETTGHEWDGLKELNNPTPRWWLWVFYITVIWSIGYWVVFPSWPTLEGHTEGTAGWTQYEQLKEQQAEIRARKGEYLDRFRQMSLEEIAQDPEMRAFAIAGGETAFKDNCATCHGTGAAGAKGYPNLNDDAWLWGGSLKEINYTLKYGIRSGHENSRESIMPAFGELGMLTDRQIERLAEYVLSLSEGKAGSDTEAAQLFADNCASCHGDQGQGMKEFGAPALNDHIWLYGGSEEAVEYTIYHARNGVMPSWSNRLDEDTIKQLTIYVHSLGGGE